MTSDTNPLLDAFASAFAADGTELTQAAPPAETPDTSNKAAEPAAPETTEAPLIAPPEPEEKPLSGDPLDMFKQATSPPAKGETKSDPAAKYPENIEGTPEAKAKWGELRNELTEATKKLSEYEQKLQAAPKDDVYKALEVKVQEYEQKVSTYEQELAIARVEATPEFKQTITAPLDAIIESAEAIAKARGIKPGDLIDAISELDPVKQEQRLSDLLDGLPERDRARVYRMADDVGIIYDKAEKLRENAATAWAEVEARQREESAREAQQRALQQRQAAQKVFAMMKERTPDIGVDLSKLENTILETDLFSATPEAIAFAASASAVLPHAVAALGKRDAKIRELETALAQFRKASPSAAPAGQTPDAKPGSDNPVAKFLFAPTT